MSTDADQAVFPRWMFLPAKDPTVKGPTVVLVECCEICFCLLPKDFSAEHKRWHLSLVEKVQTHGPCDT